MLNNKSLLITGGTGTLGKALTRRILNEYPNIKRLVIFSRDEQKQFQMAQEFSPEKYPAIRYFIGDIRDFLRLKRALKEIDYVIHTAAMKHVPIAEYNPMECIKTNVYGAENVISASLKNNVKKVLVLSTDKAVNPINLYGATKLCSDKLFINANSLAGDLNTRFSVVRYGNVIGSRGSVLPYFKDLILKKHKSLPITDERMTRFWITIESGVKFVLNSIDIMDGGELFIAKMPSIKIIDLIKALGSNLKYHVIGIRPGEKLHEVLCPTESSNETLEFKNYYLIKPFFKKGKIGNYKKNKKGEQGRYVKSDFIYSSDSNKDFLNIKDLKKLFKI